MRQVQLLSIGGLFEVAPSIYQVRGGDLSNVTFIEGNTGIIVMDPCISVETAKGGLDLYRKHRGNKPVVAVVYTHSHLDHFGGVRGVVDEKDVKAVWTYYLGYWDGNPARLDPLPPIDVGKKYVEYMGGASAVIQKARKDYEAGNCRWVAQVLDQGVSADPSNQEAKNLLAKKLESGDAKVEGSKAQLDTLLSLLDTFEFWWNVSTPNPPPAKK